MKFNRQALQQAAREALAAAKEAHDAEVAKLRAEDENALTAWVEQYGEAWANAAAAIRRKIKAGMPITRDDLPADTRFGHQVALWHSGGRSSSPRPASAYRESHELRSLITLLDTVADDEVSSSALGVLGISTAALRTAVRHLAAATARN